jgi:hypothetical protein
MANESVTLALDGDIGLAEFAIAVTHLRDLVRSLASEVAPGARIDWYIEHLDSSSAVVTARAESDDDASVALVTRGYLAVGRALEAREPIPFSSPVKSAALEIASVIDGRVEAVRFETSEADAVVRGYDSVVEPAFERQPLRRSWGAVEGVVQTLSSRRGLRFTLFDTIYDKAVSCYLSEGQEDLMRNAWGRRALVEGAVTREPDTGRPISIRQIIDVEILPDYPAGSYRLARGVIPLAPNDPSPEEAIRRVRDAQ